MEKALSEQVPTSEHQRTVGSHRRGVLDSCIIYSHGGLLHIYLVEEGGKKLKHCVFGNTGVRTGEEEMLKFLSGLVLVTE